MRFVRDIIIIVLLALALSIVARVAIDTREVFHQSMVPTIEPGEYLIVSKVRYYFKEPERGDVIVFNHPRNADQQLIKRIIGLPGDFIEIKNNQVFVNDIPLNEPYIREPVEYEYPYDAIPPDNYFVLGDNRNLSSDSHTGWTVPRENIIGRVWLTYWPPPRWKVIKHYDPMPDYVSVIMKILYEI